jgi:hypothetical protein
MEYGPDTRKLLKEWNYSKEKILIDNLNIHSIPSEFPVELRCFHCHFCPIQKIPPLPKGLWELICKETSITEIPELPEGLLMLDCSGCNIKSLPKLPSTLKRLWCNYTHIETLPELPEGLEYLSCKDTPLKELPRLPSGLNFLDCSYTPIKKLPQLPMSLIEIYCQGTEVAHLPEIPPNLRELICFQNPFPYRRQKESIQGYNLRIRAMMEKESRERVIARTRVFKEEMMMYYWHPDRYDKWAFDDHD